MRRRETEYQETVSERGLEPSTTGKASDFQENDKRKQFRRKKKGTNTNFGQKVFWQFLLSCRNSLIVALALFLSEQVSYKDHIGYTLTIRVYDN